MTTRHDRIYHGVPDGNTQSDVKRESLRGFCLAVGEYSASGVNMGVKTGKLKTG